MRTHDKRPADTLKVQIDFSEFEAAAGGSEVSYSMRSDVGIDVEVDIEGFVYTLTVTGGTLGRAYTFGIEGRSADGDSTVRLHRVRLREVQDWTSIPDFPIGGSITVYVDADGNVLLDADGNVITA